MSYSSTSSNATMEPSSPSQSESPAKHNENPLFEQLARDGFVRLEQFFPRETVERAYAEIQALYAQDLEDRAAANHNNDAEPFFKGSQGKTIFTAPSHLFLDMFGKSPTFDQMFETFLTHPVSSGVLKKLAGKNIKMRGYNIRRMTGEYDPRPYPGGPSSLPHEWHIDSPGEFCISFLFTDVDGPDTASTALVPGSHLFPNLYNPRWQCLFSPVRFKGPGWLFKFNPINRLFAKKVFKNATGGYGKAGDAYIFINDVWHGREPNLHGKHTMISFIGLFSSNTPFPDEVSGPSQEELDSLPPTFRAVASQKLPPNADESFYLNRMIHEKITCSPTNIFFWAKLERQLLEVIAPPLWLIQFLLFLPYNTIRFALDRKYRKRILRIIKNKLGLGKQP